MGGRLRGWNLGNLLVVLGLLGLGGTLWVPYASASRSSRVEARGEVLAALLLKEASAMQPLDLDDPFLQRVLLARVLRGAPPLELFANDLEPFTAPEGDPGLWFTTKHYLFRVAATPVDSQRPAPADGLPPALEVLAWPREVPSPAHSAFFCTEIGDPVFTRNLQAGYHGPENCPRPGAGHRRPDPLFERQGYYRGLDDERWLLSRRERRRTAPSR